MLNPTKHLHLLLLAISFYTRIPIHRSLNTELLAAASIYLPVIGWLVGSLTALVFYGATLLWPTPVAVLLSLVMSLLLTGALHEDGFADVCDGFGGGRDKEHCLTIMQDPRLGSFGVLGLVCLLLLKISLLTSLPANHTPWLLLAGHSLSRFAPLWLMHGYDYARIGTSKSQQAVMRLSPAQLGYAAVYALLPLLFLPGLCAVALVPMAVITLGLGRYFKSRIGGYTGDCLGASQQVTETVFYLTTSALWTFI